MTKNKENAGNKELGFFRFANEHPIALVIIFLFLFWMIVSIFASIFENESDSKPFISYERSISMTNEDDLMDNWNETYVPGLAVTYETLFMGQIWLCYENDIRQYCDEDNHKTAILDNAKNRSLHSI